MGDHCYFYFYCYCHSYFLFVSPVLAFRQLYRSRGPLKSIHGKCFSKLVCSV